MNSSEAARVLAAFHGAYPHVKVDEAMIAVWQNALAVADYDDAMEAVEEWTAIQKWWPSIAEFNGLMRTLRQQGVSSGRVALPAPPRGTPGCDGTGWIEFDDGLRPCQHCNPWNHDLIENGDWQNLRQRPPDGWVQPMPCRDVHTDSELFTFEEARAAVMRGFREHHAEIGTEPEVVERKAQHLHRAGPTVGER